MKKLGMLILCVMLSGCDACDDEGPTAPLILPNADFTYNVRQLTNSFNVEFTNNSTNRDLGRDNLDYLWEFEGNGTWQSRNPPPQTWTFTELGISGPGEVASRRVVLTVTENQDPARRAQRTEDILFEIRDTESEADGFEVF